jgi:hypothetical protein
MAAHSNIHAAHRPAEGVHHRRIGAAQRPGLSLRRGRCKQREKRADNGGSSDPRDLLEELFMRLGSPLPPPAHEATRNAPPITARLEPISICYFAKCARACVGAHLLSQGVHFFLPLCS